MFCPLSQAQLLITGLRQLCLYLSVLFFLIPVVNSANEKLTPEVQQRQQEFQQKATAKIRGQVIWPGHDLTHTTVQLYTDEKLQSTYTSVLPVSYTHLTLPTSDLV